MIKFRIGKNNFNPVEQMSARLQSNLSIFNKMIDNIKELNTEVDTHISSIDKVVKSKEQEKKDLLDIREQNTKIQANIESLLK